LQQNPSLCVQNNIQLQQIITENLKKKQCYIKVVKQHFLMQFDLQQKLPEILTNIGIDYNKNWSLLQK
jgi:hypothetical protein